MPTTMPTNLLPQLGAGLVFALAAFSGIVLLLWGRVVHRGLLVLVAAGAGLAAGGELGRAIQVNLTAAQLAGAIALGTLGLVLARFVWSALTGLTLAAIAAAAVLSVHAGMPLGINGPRSDDPEAAVRLAAEEFALRLQHERSPTLVGATAGAGGAGLILAFLLPRAAVILMTSLIGSGLLCVGAVLAVAAWLVDGAIATSIPPPIWYGLWLALLCAGLLFQTRSELRARPAGEEQAKEAEGGKAGKKEGKG